MGNIINSYIGDYRITGFLGAGGMGEVYQAVHKKIGRIAAIKILTCFDPNSRFSERFINEARIQAALHHPNIVTLYDFLEFKGRPCIIMEYMDGQTLYEHIKNRGPLPLSEVLSIFKSVVEAVDYIHSQGIVHRDIKSNNIKINSSGHVKLLDFGIAKDTVTPMLTLAGHYVGTMYYLSPEQIMGKNADHRSDVWSLGILFYEMLTGRLPFESDSISDFYRKISKVEYDSVSSLNPSMPREIETIITGCLKQNPGERFSCARDLLENVNKVANLTSSPGVMDRGKKSRPLFPPGIFSLVKKRSILILTGFVFTGGIAMGVYSFIGTSDHDSINPTIMPESSLAPLFTDPISSGPAPSGPASSNAHLVQIKIDTYDGKADIYENGKCIGQTPFSRMCPIADRINITLKRNGYRDKVVQFEVGEISNQYSYGLTKKKK